MKIVNTNELYQKQFKFPGIAKNEFSQDKFDELEIAEKNLNNNIDNDKLLTKFIETAQKIKKSFKDKYADNWSDPAEGNPESSSNVQEDTEEIDV